MQATIKFHKSIQKFTNGVSEHTLEVTSYFDLINSCLSLFPDLEKVFKKFSSEKSRDQEFVLILDKKKILPVEEIYFPPLAKDIFLSPLVFGSGRNVAIIAAVAIIAVAAIVVSAGTLAAPVAAGAGGFGSATTAGAGGFGAAIGATAGGITASQILATAFIAAGLVASFLMPRPNLASAATGTSDSDTRRNNDLFDGLQNTTSTSNRIPLNYGLTRVPGQFISGFVKTISHGKNDFIRVREQF